MTDHAAAVLDAVEALVPQLVAATSDLVAIPSVSGTAAECEAQAAMAGWLREVGLDVDHWRIDLDELTADPSFPGMEVERSEAWGLVGRLPGSGGGASLMFNGHIDVVPIGDPAAWPVPPFAGVADGVAIHGRGACDMKAGLIASVFAVRALRDAAIPLRGDVVLASVQGEEDGGLGTFALLERGWTADACVITEPTDLDVIPANSGALTFRLRVHGLATHAARRAEGVSALEQFVPVLQALQVLERRRNEHVDPLFDRWPLAHPLSVGTVHAGDWASSVPDLLVAEGRLGVAAGETVEEARAEMEAVVADLNAATPWLRDHPLELEWWGGQFASGRLPAGSDLVERVRRAHVMTTERDLDVYGAPYGSDLRLLAGAGIPTLQYGPGDVSLAHSPHESVPIDEVVTTARVLALLALDVCGVI